MILGIDGNEANVQEKVGVSVYTHELLKYFNTHASPDQRFIVYLKNPPRETLPKENEFFKYKIIKGPFLWSRIFLPLELLIGKKPDIFFSPAHYTPSYCRVPLVVTIHDLSYFFYPNEFLKKDLYKLKNWTKEAIRMSSKIIAVSKNTKKDIISQYHIDENKIAIVYNGYEKSQKPAEKIPSSIRIPYILYVGTLQPRKNLGVLLEAFQRFLITHPDHRLVIAGKKGWMYSQIYEQAESLNLQNAVEFLGFVSDSELANLYQNALFYVTPSLYEGFGIPVVEAMSFGCPVISSFASSLPEVGGNACLYFDPKDPDDLYEKMVELKENKKLRKELITKGKKQVEIFSWEKCGQETLDVIKNCYELSKRESISSST